jgi:hypothetical protein
MDVNDRQRLVRIEDKLDEHLKVSTEVKSKLDFHFILIIGIWSVFLSGVGIVVASIL